MALFATGAVADTAVGTAVAATAAAAIRQRSCSNIAAGLHRALAGNGFEMRYQPIVSLPGRDCIGVEALIRLRNHTGTLVGPSAFIPLAEHSGLIQAITERVINLVGKDLVPLLSARPDLHVGINLPPSVLEAGGMQQVAQRAGLYPLRTQVIIEITENRHHRPARQGCRRARPRAWRARGHR